MIVNDNLAPLPELEGERLVKLYIDDENDSCQ